MTINPAQLANLRDSLVPVRNAIGALWRDYRWDECLVDRLRPMNEAVLDALQKLDELTRDLTSGAETPQDS